LFPIFSFVRKHILYNSDALRELLSALNLLENKNAVKFRESSQEYWCKFFNFKKFENTKQNKFFGYSFSTDGINFSVHMIRKIQENINQKDYETELRIQYKNNEYSSFVGIDPGARCMFGLVKDEKRYLLKSSTFRYKTKEFNRKERLKHFTDTVLKFVAKDREDIENIIISCRYDYLQFTRFQLKHFDRLQKSFTRKQVSRLKWDKQINVKKILDKKANELTKTKDEKKTLIAYGNGKVHPVIKGYVKTPLKKLYMALKKNKNCSIFSTDEFRTTKLCSNCHEICLTSRSPHRFQVCQNCKKLWNRDINAARNILFKAKILIETGSYPVKFSRESLTFRC